MRALLLAVALAAVSASGIALRAQAPATPDAELAVARVFVEALAAHNFGVAVSRFDPTMRAALPDDRLATTWARLEAQMGVFKRIIATKKETSGPYQIVSTTCEFEKAALDIVTAFNPAGEIAALSFPPSSVTTVAVATAPPWTLPSYATASAYTESDITVGAGSAWPLPGTLTMPVGPGPFPVLVLVHGSGPGNRDESVGPNKPFKDLAVGLASRGIAVLRYDKRTRVHPAKMVALPRLTVKEEAVDDASVAVALARTQARIDPARVFVVGHSLGGALVPRISAAAPDVRGFIVMAGNTRSIDQALIEQAGYLANLDGRVTPEEQAAIASLQKAVDAVHALTPADADKGAMLLNAPPSYWLDLAGYEPATAAASLRQPLLILQGERDYQVTMREFATWKASLVSKRDATFKSYPALNHLFLAGTGPANPTEYLTPGHVAPDVISDIAEWVRRQ